jgi:hypothetical protein
MANVVFSRPGIAGECRDCGSRKDAWDDPFDLCPVKVDTLGRASILIISLSLLFEELALFYQCSVKGDSLHRKKEGNKLLRFSVEFAGFARSLIPCQAGLWLLIQAARWH